MHSKTYFAHSSEDSGKKDWHKLADHLKGTGTRAAEFLQLLGCADFGRVAGLLHDLGKYTPEFQERLSGGRNRIDHSTAGAQVATKRYGHPIGKMLAFCIAGHHAGLANGVTGKRTSALEDRMQMTVPALDLIWEQEIALPAQLSHPTIKIRKDKDLNTAGFCASFFIRMMFSALVDADYLDTEAWYAKQEGKTPRRGEHSNLCKLRERLIAHLDTLKGRSVPSKVNILRQQVLVHARARAVKSPGVFTLTVPTGGGKTLSSLAFALEHAVHHGLERVIYVIPYMSVIEQTAAVFRDALRGDNNDKVDFVVEHHSTFDEDRIGERESKNKLRLAMENWDAPIIVTTAVQFFESLFANRPSRCRKLHNIANSVIILDEAQTLPLHLLRPCVTALDELARNWKASIVLCTATQPALAASSGFAGGFENVRELAPDPRHLDQSLKRTRIVDRGTMDDDQLAGCLRVSSQVLCIVNTRRHARELYQSLGDVEGAFHLTTLMCAHHRREKLEAVRDRLKAGETVRLIATSLVEAGVDLDFPTVWRAEAGLESIIQAAGRCNREGRASTGEVFVFKPAQGEGRRPPREIAQFASAARSVMRSHEDPMSLDAIECYFKELYWLKGEDALDAKNILLLLRERANSLNFPFEDIAEEFRLIETAMVPIIVPWRGADDTDDTARHLIQKLDWVERPGRTARNLQPYVVQIPSRQREDLLCAGAVEVIRKDDFAQQFVVLTNQDLYRADVGLTWDDPTFRKVEGLMF